MNKCPDCLYEYNIEYEGRCPICGRDPYIFTNGELEGEGVEIVSEVIFPPKSCFGNYLHEECNNHHECAMQSECNMYTNYFKGACDCPYKKSCHEPRQRLQAMIREETGDSDIRKCDFYKYFI